jgi:hypothetical protein
MHPILKAHCETGHFSRGYLLIGDRGKSLISGREAAAILLDCGGSSLGSHPDFWEQSFDFFGLDDSNALKQKSAMKPILAKKRVFLLDINSFDNSIAASVSKILEDSPETCYFFFTAAFAENVPLLLRSRLVNLIEGDFQLSDEKRNFYERFLKSGPVERLSLAKNISSDKSLALGFLNELEVVLYNNLRGSPTSLKLEGSRTSNIISSLEELRKNRQFLFDRAPSHKMIIEHFALTLPQLK